MRDLVSKLKVTTCSTGDVSNPNHQGSGSASPDNERRSILSFMNDDICTVILDISFKRLLKKEKVSTVVAPWLGDWSCGVMILMERVISANIDQSWYV